MSDRLEKYEENMAKAYIIIYHQCSTYLKNELEALDVFPKIRADQDVIGLLRMIQGFCCSYDACIQSVMATVVASHKKLFMFYQKDGMDNHAYHQEFLAHIETIETCGEVMARSVSHPTSLLPKSKKWRRKLHPASSTRRIQL
jgi:hypothetical protein